MGLFDKLKSLVSDDKKDSGTIDIVAPLSGEIVNIEDVPDVVFAEKLSAMVLPSNRQGIKSLPLLTVQSVKFLKLITRSPLNRTAELNCLFTSGSTLSN